MQGSVNHERTSLRTRLSPIQDLPNFPSESIRCEGLFQEGNFVFHDATAKHRLTCVAALEKHLKTRITSEQGVRQFETAPARHDHVSHQ